MLLRHLTLHQFRNYPQLRQEFSPTLNLLVGPNAQGKTNLLEAIYLLATSKSLRGSRDVEMIRWDHPAAVVTGQVLRTKSNDVEVEVALSRADKKSLVVNTVRVARTMDFIGQLKVVAFCAADLETVRGEPARRRRFLDLEISQLSPSYCHTLGYYRKVTEQRSRLLKLARDRAARAAAEETLGEWTEQLVQHGSRLVERRRHFVERLQEYAQPIHALLSDQRELLTVAYRPSFRAGEEALSTTEGIQAAFRQALAHVHEEELRRQMCLVGPHRDDVTLLINGREVRTYGSQGQQRTVALSLKLAEVELMHEMSGEAPVCVLDDVFSELDARRRAHIFDVILDTCQVFLSTTDADLMPVELRRRGLVLEVSDGALRS